MLHYLNFHLWRCISQSHTNSNPTFSASMQRPAKVPGKAAADRLRPGLPATWETWVEALAPALILAQTELVQIFSKWTRRRIIPPSPSPTSHPLCCSTLPKKVFEKHNKICTAILPYWTKVLVFISFLKKAILSIMKHNNYLIHDRVKLKFSLHKELSNNTLVLIIL